MNEQGTEEWLMERAGRITASRFADVMKTPRLKSKAWADAAETYALEIAAERLTGKPAESGGSAATGWGNGVEELARRAYEKARNVEVMTAGFVEHPLFPTVGGSPDSLIGDDGVLEIKSPYASRNHLATLLAKRMPAEHKAQVQGNLWVTNREWCDFVSYDPRFGGERQLFIDRVERDEAYIEKLAERVESFEAYIQQILEETGG